MKYKIVVLVLLLLVFIGMTQTVQAKEYAHKRAILIANNNLNVEWETREFLGNMKSVRQNLIDYFGFTDDGIYFYARSNDHESYIDGEPSKGKFMNLMERIESESTDYDLTIIMYSDHGTRLGEAYTTVGNFGDSCVTFEGIKYVWSKMVCDDYIADMMEKIKGDKLVLIDACQSGGFVEEARNRGLKNTFVGSDTVIETACFGGTGYFDNFFLALVSKRGNVEGAYDYVSTTSNVGDTHIYGTIIKKKGVYSPQSYNGFDNNFIIPLKASTPLYGICRGSGNYEEDGIWHKYAIWECKDIHTVCQNLAFPELGTDWYRKDFASFKDCSDFIKYQTFPDYLKYVVGRNDLGDPTRVTFQYEPGYIGLECTTRTNDANDMKHSLECTIPSGTHYIYTYIIDWKKFKNDKGYYPPQSSDDCNQKYALWQQNYDLSDYSGTKWTKSAWWDSTDSDGNLVHDASYYYCVHVYESRGQGEIKKFLGEVRGGVPNAMGLNSIETSQWGICRNSLAGNRIQWKCQSASEDCSGDWYDNTNSDIKIFNTPDECASFITGKTFNGWTSVVSSNGMSVIWSEKDVQQIETLDQNSDKWQPCKVVIDDNNKKVTCKHLSSSCEGEWIWSPADTKQGCISIMRQNILDSWRINYDIRGEGTNEITFIKLPTGKVERDVDSSEGKFKLTISISPEDADVYLYDKNGETILISAKDQEGYYNYMKTGRYWVRVTEVGCVGIERVVSIIDHDVKETFALTCEQGQICSSSNECGGSEHDNCYVCWGEYDNDKKCTKSYESQYEGYGCDKDCQCILGLRCLNHICQVPASSTQTAPIAATTTVDNPTKITVIVNPEVNLGQSTMITVHGEDLDGVYSLWARFGDSWHSYSCNSAKTCTYSWTTTENAPGTYYYSGIAYGRNGVTGETSYSDYGYGSTVVRNAVTSELNICGNGIREEGEECDGDDLGGETCEKLGYYGGTLGCTYYCTIDSSGCDLINLGE